MPLLRRTIAALALSLVAAAPGAGAAEVRDTGVFDFDVGGFRAGILVFNGVLSGDYYAVNGRFSTAGLVALVKTMAYEATVTGKIVNGTPHPDTYVLTSNPGQDQHVETMTYTDGTPNALLRDRPRDSDPLALAPATQAGTVDTLTAIYQTMRAMPAAQACTGSIAMYDGTRHASLTLSPADGSGDTLTCKGEYRRVAGYSAKDMAHQIEMDSIFGSASLKRR